MVRKRAQTTGVSAIRGVGRDLKEVRYGGEGILGYGDLTILKYSNDVTDYP